MSKDDMSWIVERAEDIQRICTESYEEGHKAMLEQICNALGWQGGTVHQVLDEITRLRRAERLLRSCQDRMKFEANSDGGMRQHIDNEIGSND